MTKFRLYFDKDKETVWLNEMAAKGYALIGFFAGFYTFEKTEPGEYIYQIDFGSKMFAIDPNYREFMEETGVEIIDNWGYWVFLRKKAAEGEFELYTDVDSQIEHYTKIRNMFKIVTLVELICFIMELFATMNGFEAGFLFTLLIGLVVIACMKVTLSTNETILDLKERKGEKVNRNAVQTGKVSPFLICGLLCNSIPFAMERFSCPELWINIVQIVAIVLLMIGIFKTRHVFAK